MICSPAVSPEDFPPSLHDQRLLGTLPCIAPERPTIHVTDNPAKPAVTLYVVPGCPLCAQARAWLERNGVAYVERDAARDFSALRAMYRLTRQRLVPVFEYRGRALVRPTDEALTQFLL
jgi:glutaredoxin